MPMIDVTVPEGVLRPETHAPLARALAEALLRAERAPLAAPFLENTGATVRVLPAGAVHTAGTAAARTARVDVLTPPGALDRDGQRALVAEATRLVAESSTDPEGQPARTWVLLREAAEGGWGVAGHALGREEFSALTRGAAVA